MRVRVDKAAADAVYLNLTDRPIKDSAEIAEFRTSVEGSPGEQSDIRDLLLSRSRMSQRSWATVRRSLPSQSTENPRR